MKKLFYIVTLLCVISLSVSSCTEEQVKPKDGSTGGGGVIDPIK